MEYVKIPNLPIQKVKLLAVGEEYCSSIDFEKFGIDTIKIKKCTLLDKSVQSHADMQLVHIGGDMFYAQPDIVADDSLHSICKLGEGRLSRDYPECAAYNVLIIGGCVFCNTKAVDKKLADSLSQKYEIVHVNQGFARCSVCVVDNSSAISADASLEKAMTAHGIEVLRITPGYIELPGYDYGFIGGSSFKLSQNEIAFTGKLDRHPDSERILEFLHKRGVWEVYLTDREIFDIGSAVPIMEG